MAFILILLLGCNDGVTESIEDCAGVVGGNAYIDDCEQCVGGTTSLVENYLFDCDGICDGGAFIDDCDICVEGNTGLEENYLMDCNGTCSGEVFDEDEDGGYGSTGPAFTTLYGWQWESRFADGGGNITGIVEWIVLVGGMERGKFLPSASSIIGARTDKGLEFGIGPNLSLAGIGMVFGVGYNFKSGRLNLPVNISVLPGRKMTGEIQNQGGNWQTEEYEYNTGTRIAITLGFNMSK